MKKTSVYIHIPFCRQKCHYCDFLSFAGAQARAEEYTSALLNEMEAKSDFMKEKEIETVYFGGGTPSSIDEKFIEKILTKLRKAQSVSKNAEITIELNPGTITEDKIALYMEVGINRFSIGLQSSVDSELEKIGRIHNYEDFLDGFNLLRKMGAKNISVDLMTGLPGQSLESFNEGLEKVFKLDPEHLSCYGLILEEGTLLWKRHINKEFEIDDELERDMYKLLVSKSRERGYEHYEISNFAKPGFRSAHNTVYWNLDEYIGLGLGAHSFADNLRFSNTADFEEYVNSSNNNKDVTINKILVDRKSLMEEFMFLGLRKIEGISFQDFKTKFGNDIHDFYGKAIEKLLKQKLLLESGEGIKLSVKGLDFANIVFREFIGE
ncbi:radical SAM family heme chaperone HemW [Alkalibacter mobilis]|uniref:radical SAM family heme chaperone HemW n=1 Tax=Alkalibacter mobilis TaxID=2787712 RepID=UPI0018A11E76|nr:radical SAM family heme chaperone HemW [Alkalibacter mobilis]MBF7097406.1 oxygen-independent coproporphyrinogen III oxidase [Alkalibacter mobilis]